MWTRAVVGRWRANRSLRRLSRRLEIEPMAIRYPARRSQMNSTITASTPTAPCGYPAVRFMASKIRVTGPHGNDWTNTVMGTSNGSNAVVATRNVSRANRAQMAIIAGSNHARAAACGSPAATSAAASLTGCALSGGVAPRWRSTPAAQKPDPPRARQRVQAQRDEAQRYYGEEQSPEWLPQEEQEHAAEPVHLGRIPVEATLKHEPSHQCERDSPGEVSESTQHVDDVL